MRKRYQIAVAVFIAAIVGVIAWEATRPRQPVYNGKTLGRWLSTSFGESDRDPAKREAGEEAVRQIGTNAIPTLLRLLRMKDSAMKTRVITLARSQHIINIQCEYAGRWNQIAEYAFSCLGTNAQTAVPALLRIAEENISPTSRSYAIETLGWIGPPAKEAVPSLLLWATNEVVPVRRYARFSLLRIDREAAARAGITNDQ